jgi:glutamate-1-semialdehyde 2,1-aminomutase
MGSRSKSLLQRAQRIIPGGVNSPVRAFNAVGGNPPFIRHGYGAHLKDADGKTYIDYVCSWGPLILGHAHSAVVDAVQKAAAKGTSFGAPTEGEIALAELITEAFPSIEMVRMVNSGTEACMSAIRLARSFTGRNKIVKFSGCYHGHADGLLAIAGSGSATLNVLNCEGVPDSYLQELRVLPFNNLTACEQLFAKRGHEIAAVIVEPIAGNMGVILPKEGFLQGLREITQKYQSVLIFDEIITGFRVSWGGVQNLYNILPDITCLGKIIGGGLPVGAYGGRRHIMQRIAPLGGVYQAGTLSGNPVAIAAGLATLKILKKKNVYNGLHTMANTLCAGIQKMAEKYGIPVQVASFGSMFTVFFNDRLPECFEDAKTCNIDQFKEFFHGMLRHGVYLPPSQFESAFISCAHTTHDIDTTVEAAGRVFKMMKQKKSRSHHGRDN